MPRKKTNNKLKFKRAPRGRPFPKGHTFGNRFKKGQSGNPGGRPKSAKLSEAYRALLELPPDEPPPLSTNAERVAAAIIGRAVAADIGAAREVADRAEGRAPVAVQVNNVRDPLLQLIEGMNKLSDELGPPPQDYEENENDDN
jgi:hypothetical protein